jgi:hypothetical protein
MTVTKADDQSAKSDGAIHRRSIPSTPRWVRLFGIAGIVLVLVFFLMHLTGTAPMTHGMP